MVSRDDPRVRLAAERTLLAWIRTGLAMMGFGFVVARSGALLQALAGTSSQVKDSVPFSHWIGITLIGLGAVATLVSAWQQSRFMKGTSREARDGLPNRYFGIAVAIVLSGIGMLMVAYLVHSER